MTDPIADLINRINNAKSARKETTEIPYSKVKEEILKVLKDEGCITGFTSDKENGVLVAGLEGASKKYQNIVRYSRPGRRVYVKKGRIPRPKSGFGIVVISTPLGVLSGDKARKSGVGGEIICEVW